MNIKKTFTKLYKDGHLILYHRPISGFKTFCFSSITSLKNNLYSSSHIKYNRARQTLGVESVGQSLLVCVFSS